MYYIGHCARKVSILKERRGLKDRKDGEERRGLKDTKDGEEYEVNVFDHIAYRYEIKELIGKGSFGQVIKAYDHKRKELVAVKIIGKNEKFNKQAVIELNILCYIKERDDMDSANIVRIIDFVVFRKHVVHNNNFINTLLRLNTRSLYKNSVSSLNFST